MSFALLPFAQKKPPSLGNEGQSAQMQRAMFSGVSGTLVISNLLAVAFTERSAHSGALLSETPSGRAPSGGAAQSLQDDERAIRYRQVSPPYPVAKPRGQGGGNGRHC